MTPRNPNKNDQLVIALFEEKAQADEALKALRAWDKATESITLGAMATLTKNARGQIEYHRQNTSAVQTGVKIGLVTGGVIGALVLGGPVALGTLLGFAMGGAGVSAGAAAYSIAMTLLFTGGGVAGGGALGASAGGLTGRAVSAFWGFPHEEIERVGAHLSAGKAATLILLDAYEVAPTEAELTRLGGQAPSHVQLAPEAVAAASKLAQETADATSPAAASEGA